MEKVEFQEVVDVFRHHIPFRNSIFDPRANNAGWPRTAYFNADTGHYWWVWMDGRRPGRVFYRLGRLYETSNGIVVQLGTLNYPSRTEARWAVDSFNKGAVQPREHWLNFGGTHPRRGEPYA